jgi:hypothetical protein
MNSKKLSFGFAFYGLILLAAGAFCFWFGSIAQAGWLTIAGFGFLTWAHFLNRKQFWSFKIMLTQLFLMCGILGWNVLAYFQAQAGLIKNNLTANGFQFFSGLFLLSVVLLLIATKATEKIRRELN